MRANREAEREIKRDIRENKELYKALADEPENTE